MLTLCVPPVFPRGNTWRGNGSYLQASSKHLHQIVHCVEIHFEPLEKGPSFPSS